MQHMNSVRIPVTVIFSALLVIIIVSASRTTYKFSTEHAATALGPCAQSATMREADCPSPRALSRQWPRKVHPWPSSPDSGVEFAAPEVPSGDAPAHAQHAGDRTD